LSAELHEAPFASGNSAFTLAAHPSFVEDEVARLSWAYACPGIHPLIQRGVVGEPVGDGVGEPVGDGVGEAVIRVK
jgi:hypothetical protein